MEEERSRLADLIEKHAISYSNEPFTLASGAKSNFYFDLRQVSGDAEGITAIARLLYNMITEIGGIKSVGGLESGCGNFTIQLYEKSLACFTCASRQNHMEQKNV